MKFSKETPEKNILAAVKASLAGEEDASRDLYEYVFRIASTVGVRMLGITDWELDEFAHDCCVKIILNLSKFGQTSKLFSWAYRVCSTEALMLLRSGRARDKNGVICYLDEPVAEGERPLIIETKVNPEREYSSREILSKLSTEVKDWTLLLEIIDGASVDDLAKANLTTSPAIGSRVFRARRAARKILEPRK